MGIENNLRTAIVRPPGMNFVAGLTSVRLGSPDVDRARQQHESYCSALEKCGLRVVSLEADDRYPDSTFVEDTAVITGRCAILSRPGAASRAEEVDSIRMVLAQFYSELHFIREPGTLDGGDVCEAGNHFFIGISERTNRAGARQLAELLRSVGYTTSLVDIRGLKGLLHLKSGVAYLGDNRLVVINVLADREEFRGYERIHVEEGEEYGANCVRVNNGLLVATGHPRLEATLRSLSYLTLSLEMSEFQKMDGGLSCLSLRF